jgi:hypothetical protein
MSTRPLIASVILLFTAGVCADVQSADVYKWVDEDGVVHYSDQPVEGAERVEVSTGSQSSPGPALPPPQYDAADDGDEGAQAFSYTALSISSPEAEQTLWNIQGTLSVSLNLQPSLRRGDRIRVYLDGELQAADTLQFLLEDVWRGQHNLQAEVLDQSGALMIRSEPIRFFVQQTSVAN